MEGAKNIVVDKDGKHLEDTCTVPYTDYLDINLHKFTNLKKLVSNSQILLACDIKIKTALQKNNFSR